MIYRICICCGESIPDKGNGLSRNPNVCSSCSSLMDGMEEASGQGAVEHSEPHKLAAEAGSALSTHQSVPAVVLESATRC